MAVGKKKSAFRPPPLSKRLGGRSQANAPERAQPNPGAVEPQTHRSAVKALQKLFGKYMRIGLIWAAALAGSQPAESAPLQPALRRTNSLGLVLVPVPGTKVLFAIWETRVRDFAAFVAATGHDTGNSLFARTEEGWTERPNLHWRNPGFRQTTNDPVVGVNWEDARRFCAWLTERERAAGLLHDSETYRLPTHAEWEYAVRRGTGEGNIAGVRVTARRLALPSGAHWPEDADGADVVETDTLEDADGFRHTAPVGSFAPNAYGLCDLWGNVWEWCADWFQKEFVPEESRQLVPAYSADGGGRRWRVLRGASFYDSHSQFLKWWLRCIELPENRLMNAGFRIVLELAPSPPLNASTPPTAFGENASQAEPFTNSLGMVFRTVPGTRVRFAIWETRELDYAVFCQTQGCPTTNHSRPFLPPALGAEARSGNRPVVGVNYFQATAFCDWLTRFERERKQLGSQQRFRLPTDAEWSAAAGLANEPAGHPAEKSAGGRSEMYPWGRVWPPPRGSGNYSDATARLRLIATYPGWHSIPGYQDGFAGPAPVGSFPANPYGLHDLGGNVKEWCADWFDELEDRRVLRGASWLNYGRDTLRTSFREGASPEERNDLTGFRVVLEDLAEAPATARAR